MTIQLDALVRGEIGFTARVGEARVYRVSNWGWVAGIDSEGRQVIISSPEVIGEPRPVKDRLDIPERFR